MLRLGRISGHTVNGGWSSWSSWSQCSRDCSRGIRSRKRTCSNPEPKYGGQTCLGPAQEYQECNITPCPGKKCTHASVSCTDTHTNTIGTRTHRDKNICKTRSQLLHQLSFSLTLADKHTLLHTILKLCFSLINGLRITVTKWLTKSSGTTKEISCR